MDKPFWETTYADRASATFGKEPTRDVAEFAHILPVPSLILDVGCGEGRNALYLAKLGHRAEGFDISQNGVDKAAGLALQMGLNVKFWRQDLAAFNFEKGYDAILSHGVLHLPEKAVRDEFLRKARERTNAGGYNFIAVFTDKRPATPDNAPFTKSLFKVGELPAQYEGWEIIHHEEGVFNDEHPGGVRHEHAYERVIARKR